MPDFSAEAPPTATPRAEELPPRPATSRSAREALLDFVCVLFPGLVLLVCVPFSIFLPNQEAVSRDLTLFAPFAAGLAAWSAVALAAALLRLRRLATFFLVLGQLLLVRDVLTPVRSSGLVGLDPSVVISEAPLAQSLLEAALVVAALGALWLVSAATLRKVLFPIAAVFLAMQAVVIPAKIEWRAMRSGGQPPSLPAAAPLSSGSQRRGNVYILCLDSFLGNSFPDAVRAGGLEPDFAGFLYYPNNRSNYTFTLPSIATALGGGLFPGGSANEWYEQHYLRAGLLGSAAATGYDVWEYAGASNRNDHVLPERFRSRPKYLSQVNRRNYSLKAVWLTRLAPAALRKKVWQHLTADARSSFFLSVSNLTMSSLRHLRMFADDEAARPAFNQFVFAHFYIPHSPYCFDAECNELTRAGTYLPQAVCSLRPLADWLRTLRAKVAFDESTIVIFSDHGQEGRGTGTFVRRLVDQGDGAPQRLLAWSNALLLFKPPAGRRAVDGLAIDTRYSQTLDIPVTIADVAGLAADVPGGASLLQPAAGNPRIQVVDKFSDLYERHKKRRTEFDTVEADLDHWVFSPREGWRFEGAVRTRW